MDLGFGQISMVATIAGLTQFLKNGVLDNTSVRWGRSNKFTIVFVYIASVVLVFMNFENLPFRSMVEATVMYSLLASGFHAQVKGGSMFLKKFSWSGFIRSIIKPFRREK